MKRSISVVLCSFIVLLAGCQQVLLNKLTEPQANDVVAALAERGIGATKVPVDDTLWKIEVDGNHLTLAVQVLQESGLPGAKNPTMGEIFKKEGLVSSPTEERVRYVYAISQELATTLKRIDGVIDARVHVVLPNNDPLAERVVPSSASIFIKHRPNVNLAAAHNDIKNLVQSSVEGLDYEHISLFMFPATAAPQKDIVAATTKTVQQNSVGAVTQWLPVLFAGLAIFLSLFVFFSKRTERAAAGQGSATSQSDTRGKLMNIVSLIGRRRRTQ